MWRHWSLWIGDWKWRGYNVAEQHSCSEKKFSLCIVWSYHSHLHDTQVNWDIRHMYCTYEKPTFYHLSYDVNLKIMSLIVLTVCGDVFFLTNTEACQDYLKNCHQSAISLFWRSLLVIKNASPKILWRRLCRSRGRFCSEIRISGIYSAFTKRWRQDFRQFAKLKYIIYMYIVRKWAACNRSNTPIFLNWY